MKIEIEQNLDFAWERWIAEVPDDFPADASPTEQLAWLEDNYELISFLEIKDAGYSSGSFEDVEVL